MKLLTAVIIFFVCTLSSLQAQDLDNKINEQAEQILQLQQKQLEDSINYNQRLAKANEVAASLNQARSAEKLRLNNEIVALQREVSTLTSRLDKSNIMYLEATAQRRADSIILLQGLVAAGERQFRDLEQQCRQREEEASASGRQLAFGQIAATYKSWTFDELISATSLESVKRDLSLIGNDVVVREILLNLQKYHTAEGILLQKYDPTQVQMALKELADITIAEPSEKINLLRDRIDKYKMRTEDLRSTVDKIVSKDRVFHANDADSTKTKEQIIMADLASYIFNYDFHFTEYPYLAKIINDIMIVKLSDANKDITDLRSRI